ncbi:MAG TPA: PPOX class F420-dependent oxidoreductase [Micromonospora sp.]
MTVPDEIRRSRYVSLTTYRRDGSGVATPVWHVLGDDGELLVITEARSWKVKRIRRNDQVLVAVCDVRGRVEPGTPSHRGTARLLDERETEAGRRLLARRYVLSRVGNALSRLLRLRRPPMIGIAVRLTGATG